jgi:hypothetical protein
VGAGAAVFTSRSDVRRHEDGSLPGVVAGAAAVWAMVVVVVLPFSEFVVEDLRVYDSMYPST